MVEAGSRSQRSCCSYSRSKLVSLAVVFACLTASISAKPSTDSSHKAAPEPLRPTGPYLTHAAEDCPAFAQVCLSSGLTFPLADGEQHGFDPHPKDRPDKYSPITQAFPITITSRESLTGLQFEAVDEDCVRPWLSGMAGQEGSLLMQLFWGGQIEFNVPAVFPTEPESMLELPPQLAPALFAIAGVGSAHPPEKQLCISGVHVTYGDETETRVATSINCPFNMSRCTPAVSYKAETELIPGRLATLYKQAAFLPAADPYTYLRVQSGITELLARTHPDDARVINETVAGALLRQELGAFDAAAAPPGIKTLIAYAKNSTADPNWPGVSRSSKQAPRGQQPIAKHPSTTVLGYEEDAEDEDGDDNGFGREQAALLDSLWQAPAHHAPSGHSQRPPSRPTQGKVMSNAALAAAYQANQAAASSTDESEGATPLHETPLFGSQEASNGKAEVEETESADQATYMDDAPWDVSRRRIVSHRRVLQQASGLEANEPGLPSAGTGATAAELEGPQGNINAALDQALAGETALPDPTPEVLAESNVIPDALSDLSDPTSSGGLTTEPTLGLEQAITAGMEAIETFPPPPATLTAIPTPVTTTRDSATDASMGFDDAMESATLSSEAVEEADKHVTETFGSSAADMPEKDPVGMPPAGAPSESKKPHAVHEAATAAMGATAKTKSSKPLAPGSHAAAPDNVPTSLPPSPAKSSAQATGGLWGKAKNMFGLGGGKPRSAAEEEELLEELAEEEEDAGMMESVLRTSTGSPPSPSGKSAKGGTAAKSGFQQMKQKEELLREAEEEIDAQDREYLSQGAQAAEKAGTVPSTATAATKEAAAKTTPNPEGASSSSKQAIAEQESQLEAEMESWEAMEEAAETGMAGATTMASAGKLQPKGGKGSVAASPAASPASSMEAGTGRGNTSAAKSSQLSETATEELLEELAMEEDAIAYDEPYLEEDIDIRAADQKTKAQKQASKGTVPGSPRKLPPGGAEYDLGTPGRESLATKDSKADYRDTLDELEADLEDGDLEATDATLPATGAGSGLTQKSGSSSKGKAAAAPKAGSTAAKKAGSTEKGTLAFDEDEPEALTMPGGSSSASSKTGSTKLPEAFREDVTGNDTFRQKASKGDLPGAAKTSGMAANLLDSSAKSSDLLGSKTNSSGAAGAKKDSGVSGLSAGSFGGGASTDDERDMGPDMSSSSSKPGSLASKPGSKSTAGDDEDDLPFGMGSSSSSSKKGPSANKPGSKSTSGSMADDEEDSPFPMGSSSSSSSSSKKGSSGSKPGSKSVSGSMADDDDELDLGTGSSSSKMSKSQPGSTVSRGTAGSTSDSVGGLDERDEYSVGLGGKDSSKGLAGLTSSKTSDSSSGQSAKAPSKSAAASSLSQKLGSKDSLDLDLDSPAGLGGLAGQTSSKGTGQSTGKSTGGSSSSGLSGKGQGLGMGSSGTGSNDPFSIDDEQTVGLGGSSSSFGGSSKSTGSSTSSGEDETKLDAKSSSAVRDALKSAKDATLSGKGLTGFDGPESMTEMMDEQVIRTGSSSSALDELAAPSKPSRSTSEKINGLIFSPGSSTRNLIVVSILGAVAGAVAIHYYRILRVTPAQKRIVDLRNIGNQRRTGPGYSRVGNHAAQSWDKDWNDDNWDDSSERGIRQKPSR